jgi:hypothetical protein
MIKRNSANNSMGTGICLIDLSVKEKERGNYNTNA